MMQHKRHSQGSMALKFSEYLVILRFKRWYPKQNTVTRQKQNILTPLKCLGWLRHCDARKIFSK